MKAQIKARSNLIVEVEGDDEAELFENISSASETFVHAECGCCKGTDIAFVVRQDDEDNKYYELHCKDFQCRARLPFGLQKKGGKLYPKRRWDSLSNGKDDTKVGGEKLKRANEKEYADKHGGYLANNGWYKYVPEKKPTDKPKG